MPRLPHPFDSPAWSELLALVVRAGKHAQRIAAQDFTTEIKKDGSPVTLADRELNALLLQGIKALYPGESIVSEESAAEMESGSRHVWYIDPIDGTKEFCAHGGDWSVVVGRAYEGVPERGVVYHPASERLYFAEKGHGAFVQAQGRIEPLRGSARTVLAAAIVAASRNHPHPAMPGLFERLGVKSHYTHGSVALKICHIAEGRADLYFNLSGQCQTWDVCGPAAILSEAGGIVRLFDGRTLRFQGADQGIRAAYFGTNLSMEAELRRRLAEAGLDR